MHIIALENEPSSRRGGQELNLLEICRGLSKRGHTITLLYLKEGDLLKHYEEFCSQLVNVKTFMLDRHNISYTFNFLADIFRVAVTKNSVVYSNRYQDIFFGFVLSLLNNIPQVCYLQLPPPGGFGRPHTMALKRVKKFIAVSNKTKLDWINSGFKDERIDVVYNGADSAVFKPSKDFSLTRKEWNIPEGTRVISYVGRLDKEKGLETLLKAFAAIVKSGANAKLLIAGKPVSQGEEYKKSLEKLVSDLGIEKYVSFLGHVNNTTSVYQVSDITVLPSLWSEPFGRTVVESMTCGTPVVASRTGGIPEILTKEFQSGLFEAGDERNLADTLNRIINWRDKDRQLGERCREYVLSKFTLDKLVEGIEQVLLGVVKQ
ncbi:MULTISPECIES: glycosyltransferase family 4 protein [Cyanophyceae]|uniref:glycosyltransferase family 4 protein n=1 Tax=Cyanophyceae TaxID=3028117 RepID=UPI0016888395|nr:glycosyltransferase family 4 protein [Trichocoleus sp. FACHB-69]MBD1935710.1 glycosyltransferase family 4 protein [Trichocoleus sp. FACHB-69]